MTLIIYGFSNNGVFTVSRYFYNSTNELCYIGTFSNSNKEYTFIKNNKDKKVK